MIIWGGFGRPISFEGSSMTVSFRIFMDYNFVYVHCSGYVDVAETMAAFQDYVRHEDFRPGQSQLVDLLDVSDYGRDFAQIMALQAHQSDVFLSSESPIHLIFVADNDLTRSMAMAALRSWQNLPGVVPLVVSDLDEATEILGAAGLTLPRLKEKV
jgi:hypothetical protein